MSVWMAGLPDAFQALWLPAVLLSGVVTGVLLAGGPRRRGPRTVEQAAPSHETGRPAFAAGEIDLGGELRGIAEGQGAAAAARRIRLQVALEPNLIVRADPLAVHAIVGDLLRNAIGHSEGGHVLLGAARHGGRVRITVGDDGTPVDRAEQVADLRDAERLVALQGGTFEISVQSKSGTLVTVRLPDKPAISTVEKTSSGAIEQIAAERRAPAAARVE